MVLQNTSMHSFSSSYAGFLFYNELTPWNRHPLEKLIEAQLVKLFVVLMEVEVLLPYSQQPAIQLYHEPEEVSLYILFQ
jgi:hypothetical protein